MPNDLWTPMDWAVAALNLELGNTRNAKLLLVTMQHWAPTATPEKIQQAQRWVELLPEANKEEMN